MVCSFCYEMSDLHNVRVPLPIEWNLLHIKHGKNGQNQKEKIFLNMWVLMNEVTKLSTSAQNRHNKFPQIPYATNAWGLPLAFQPGFYFQFSRAVSTLKIDPKKVYFQKFESKSNLSLSQIPPQTMELFEERGKGANGFLDLRFSK